MARVQNDKASAYLWRKSFYVTFELWKLANWFLIYVQDKIVCVCGGAFGPLCVARWQDNQARAQLDGLWTMKIGPLVSEICPRQNLGAFSAGLLVWLNGKITKPGHMYSQRAFMWLLNHDNQATSLWYMSWTRFGGLLGTPVWLWNHENLPISLRDILWTKFGYHLSPLLAPVVGQGQNDQPHLWPQSLKKYFF